MITSIDIDTSPLAVGEWRVFRIEGDSAIFVAIQCFRRPPDPPELQPCAACGSYEVEPGQSVRFTAPAESFEDTGGYLEIKIRDTSGDSRRFRIEVNTDTNSFGGMSYGG